jgi:hypothetical protein
MRHSAQLAGYGIAHAVHQSWFDFLRAYFVFELRRCRAACASRQFLM